MYYANFSFLMRYGQIFWGDSMDAQKIIILQKCAFSSMLKLPYREHCREYFCLNEILPMPCLYILKCVLLLKNIDVIYFLITL